MVSNDLTDSHSEHHSNDRKKRDTANDDEHIETTIEIERITAKNDRTNVEHDAENGKRTVRQLRGPPQLFGQAPWPPPPPPPPDNFRLQNDPRLLPAQQRPHHSVHFARDTDLNVNYNTFLPPPGNGQQNGGYYKNEALSAAFAQLAAYGKQQQQQHHQQQQTQQQKPRPQESDYNPYGNPSPYGTVVNHKNAVTEFNSQKPYTIHTSFDLSDAQAHYKTSTKSNSVTQFPFHPLVINNGEPKTQKPLLVTHTNSPAGDVDSLPENFSYFNMGTSSQKNEPHTVRIGNQKPHVQPQIPIPQPPVYFLDKPGKALPASTPKNHYVQVSTLGGFLNHNPTVFTGHDPKKLKLRPTTEKFDFNTHRPVYHDVSVSEENRYSNNNNNGYYNNENTDVSPYLNPLTSLKLTKTPLLVTTAKPFYNSESPFKNFNPNSLVSSAKPLYSYEVTSDEVRPTEKAKGYYQTQSDKSTSGEQFVRPPIKLAPAPPQKHQEPSLTVDTSHETLKKRPPIVGPQVGVNFDFNKFVYNIREAHKTAPKLNTIARPVEPNTVYIRPPNKPLPNNQNNKPKIETTTANPDDYYYDVDEQDDEQLPTTTSKKPVHYEPNNALAEFTTHKHKTSTFADQTTKSIKANFVQPNSVVSTQQTIKSKVPKTEEEYEYEYEDEDADDDEEDYKMPPQNVSKFMPMSETAAPRPYPITTRKPLSTTSSPHTTTTAKKYVSNYDRHYYSKTTTTEATSVPAIIKFPEDIFQGIRTPANQQADLPRYLNQSAIRPYTSRTRIKTTRLPGADANAIVTQKPLKSHIKTTTPYKYGGDGGSKYGGSSEATDETNRPSTETTSTPKTKTLTIRTKFNNNLTGAAATGQNKSPSIQQSTRWNKQTNKAQKPQRTNALKKNLWEFDERLPNRYYTHFNRTVEKPCFFSFELEF